MLLAELGDFVTRHRPCGQLTGDATEPAPNGYMLSVAYSCGVTFLRWVTPEEAMRELVLSEAIIDRIDARTTSPHE